MLDQALLAVPCEDYVRALAGREPTSGGKIACPFHHDDVPSLQLYADGTWYCFGCRRGGSIYDFAAHSWGVGTRGAEFIEFRDRLSRHLGIVAHP